MAQDSVEGNQRYLRFLGSHDGREFSVRNDKNGMQSIAPSAKPLSIEQLTLTVEGKKQRHRERHSARSRVAFAHHSSNGISDDMVS